MIAECTQKVEVNNIISKEVIPFSKEIIGFI
jgi:hypothetical protein